MELCLPELELTRLARAWLAEDAPKLEIGGFVVGDARKTAKLLGKSPGVFCGKPFAQHVFGVFPALRVQWLIEDGQEISPQDAKAKKPVALVEGPARLILLVERTVLNILARASGIATYTRRMVQLVRAEGWNGELAATRKTTPGFALVEKYAVLVGGGSTHRMDLSQMTMLKDNHVWAVGSITKAVKQARTVAGFSSKIEVEARTYEEACEACEAKADIVMLDNMTPDQIKRESKRIKHQYPHVILEASGGITEASVKQYLCPELDVISVGRFTQGYSTMDFSLKIDPSPSTKM